MVKMGEAVAHIPLPKGGNGFAWTLDKNNIHGMDDLFSRNAEDRRRYAISEKHGEMAHDDGRGAYVLWLKSSDGKPLYYEFYVYGDSRYLVTACRMLLAYTKNRAVLTARLLTFSGPHADKEAAIISTNYDPHFPEAHADAQHRMSPVPLDCRVSRRTRTLNFSVTDSYIAPSQHDTPHTGRDPEEVFWIKEGNQTINVGHKITFREEGSKYFHHGREKWVTHTRVVREIHLQSSHPESDHPITLLIVNFKRQDEYPVRISMVTWVDNSDEPFRWQQPKVTLPNRYMRGVRIIDTEMFTQNTLKLEGWTN